MAPPTDITAQTWTKADAAFTKGREAYIEFGQELLRLYQAGNVTQEQIAQRYDIGRSAVAHALGVGGDERIVTNRNNLPCSQRTLYLLTTLPDSGFEKLCRPDTTEADVKAYKDTLKQAKRAAVCSGPSGIGTTPSRGATRRLLVRKRG